ncbi:MAG: hypothetical protein A3J48_01030 [Candidatus Doudnabacteria bacterium RIFCSPHIGHO2_02_FULL_46_11]|uniref:Uncharacterized protein n=1 Tax=Candidatus Doudnabacteria bacterium RIFCSPHIGHO2_02_FULL_46_11 TaxID=1817832 RepID=A0A1F5P7S6_9BACT|nr:MAG: hypothetical protein A3J48_01030 [Candidatus Doudnabacteria bacterium RIFCSPHIGHO2_02_FULL_46_11]
MREREPIEPADYGGRQTSLDKEQSEKFEKDMKVKVIKGGPVPRIGELVMLHTTNGQRWGRITSFERATKTSWEIEYEYTGD